MLTAAPVQNQWQAEPTDSAQGVLEAPKAVGLPAVPHFPGRSAAVDRHTLLSCRPPPEREYRSYGDGMAECFPNATVKQTLC